MKINVKGPIIGDAEQWIYDWFGIPATSPSKVNQVIEQALQNNVAALDVSINSGGGSVFSASEIYTELRKFQGDVRVEIVGLAASAASVIAMAGTSVKMSPTGSLMIHNAMASTSGDYREMDATSELLQKVNQSIVSTYLEKTGKTQGELKAMMDKETWMTAPEAKELGFIDEIMFEQTVDAVANIEVPELVNGMLPKEVIDKMRVQLANNKELIVTNSTSTKPIHKGGNKKMDLETLKNEHPDLAKELVQAAVKNERNRIQEIENIAVPGAEEIIKAAKFETGITAGEVAVEILQNEKMKKSTILTNLQEDAAPLENIESGTLPQNSNHVDDFVDSILNNTGMMGGQ